MKKTDKTTQKTAIKIDYVPDLAKVLRPAEYNARDTTDAQLNAICRSIVEFGIVDPLIARREDGLILGGHQRFKAVARLLSGPFRFKHKGGQVVTVNWSDPKPVVLDDGTELQWKAPEEGFPVVFLEGVTDKRAKLLNLALNRATGEWEHDKVADLLKSLTEDFDLNELGATAFTPAELTDYLDIADEKIELTDEGTIPAPAQGSPKLSLDFSSKELRDAVKSALAAAAKDEEPSGDTVARMLGVKVKRMKPRAA